MPPHALSPQATAQLIHEAIGHMAEADFMLACGHQSPFLRLPPLSKKITIMDYAHTAFNKPCPVPMHFDDETTPAIDVCIIKEGQRTGYMTNLYTAEALSLPLTGNARRATPDDEPMVRMRNTALLPGHDSPEDIIASIEDGFYLAQAGSCYGDINGDFACEIKSGYAIKNGKLCRPVNNFTIFGRTAEFLQSISMVGNDFEWFTDDCTKWQIIKVGQGAPTIKASLQIV